MEIIVNKARMQYSERWVLDVAGLRFLPGRIYFIMGANGSGKTTLVEGIARIRAFTEGDMEYRGLPTGQELRHSLTLMEQSPYLFNMTARDNIICGLKFRNVSEEAIEGRLEKYLGGMGMGDYLSKKPGSLSGGEREKVALLRTLILETPTVILDEPTSAMDIESSFQAEALLRKFSGEGRCVIVVSHDFHQAERLADHLIFLDGGKLLEQGEARRVLSEPESEMLKRILNKRKIK